MFFNARCCLDNLYDIGNVCEVCDLLKCNLEWLDFVVTFLVLLCRLSALVIYSVQNVFSYFLICVHALFTLLVGL